MSKLSQISHAAAFFVPTHPSSREVASDRTHDILVGAEAQLSQAIKALETGDLPVLTVVGLLHGVHVILSDLTKTNHYDGYEAVEKEPTS